MPSSFSSGLPIRLAVHLCRPAARSRPSSGSSRLGPSRPSVRRRLTPGACRTRPRALNFAASGIEASRWSLLMPASCRRPFQRRSPLPIFPPPCPPARTSRPRLLHLLEGHATSRQTSARCARRAIEEAGRGKPELFLARLPCFSSAARAARRAQADRSIREVGSASPDRQKRFLPAALPCKGRMLPASAATEIAFAANQLSADSFGFSPLAAASPPPLQRRSVQANRP